MNAHALYAYNTSNGTSWLAADLREPGYDMTPHTRFTAMPSGGNLLSLEIPCILTPLLRFGRHERALVPRAQQVTQKFTLTTLETKRHGVLLMREEVDGVVRATTAMLLTTCFI